MKMKPVLLLLSGILLSGCGGLFKSDYTAPPVTLPGRWQSVPEDKDARYPFAWRDFNDPQLSALQRQMQLRNADVALAISRIQQAALEAEQTTAQQMPSLSGSLSASSGRQLDFHDQWRPSATGSLEISLPETDLTGKLARQREIAALSVRDNEQALRQARLLLTESVSNNYWQLGILNERLALSRQDIDTARATLQLVMLRWQTGKVSGVDVVNARQNLLSVEMDLGQLQRQRLEARNVQSQLAGMPPGKILAEPAQLPRGSLPAVRAGLPARILARRPDVHQAELALRQALATADISRAELYPAFSLSGLLGTTSAELLAFISNPTASLAASLSLPFLDWHTQKLAVQVADNHYQQQVITFRRTLYAAMVEMDDALTQQAQLRAEKAQLESQLALARRSEALSEIRYRAGAEPLNFWLDAQRQRRLAESQVIANRFSLYQALARLSVVSGGARE